MSSMKKDTIENNVGSSVPDQKAWEVAVKCHVDGMTDVQAIPYVYDAMMAPALLKDLAIIMATVYADTYWNNTKMDPMILSTSLQKYGWKEPDATKAAKAAFSQWRGLLARCSTSDNGLIPRGGATTNSPDALNGGDAILIRSELLNKWNSYFWKSGYVGKNNIYGRAQSINIPIPINEAKARMYIYEASINPPPSGWQQLYTPDGQSETKLYGKEEKPVSANELVASDQFIWNNTGSGHYCILHCPSTEFFKNDPRSINPTNWNLWEWLACNGAAGWHNIDVPNGEDRIRIFNHDETPEKYILEAHCSKVPNGTEVTLECNTQCLPTKIMTRPMKINSRYQLLSTSLVELPPYFDGELIVRIKTPGKNPLPAEASVEVRMLWILHHGHTHYDQAVELLGDYRNGVANRPVRLQIGNFTFVGKID